MEETHPAAVGHLPPFITGPDQTDVLFVVVVVFLIGIVLLVGNLYLRLHALPEHVAHRTNKVQLEIVAILALIALFTHNHLYWIAALLLAFVHLPDFSTPMASMAESLAKLARTDRRRERIPVILSDENSRANLLQTQARGDGRTGEEPKGVQDAKIPTDELEVRG